MDEDLRIDNLKLRALVDKRLAELSDNKTAAPILYSPEYEGSHVYSISGDYAVTGNEISVSLLLTKGGADIQTRLEIKELTTRLDLLSGESQPLSWIGRKITNPPFVELRTPVK